MERKAKREKRGGKSKREGRERNGEGRGKRKGREKGCVMVVRGMDGPGSKNGQNFAF